MNSASPIAIAPAAFVQLSDQRLRMLTPVLLVAAQLPLAYAENSITRVVVLVAAAVVGWWWVDRPRRAGLSMWLATPLVLIATVYLIYEWQQTHPVLALSHYIALLSVIKLLQRKSSRDYGQLVVLSLLLLVIGGVVNETLVYGVCLLVFLSVGLYIIIVLHFRRELDLLEQRRRSAGLTFSMAVAGRDTPPLRGMTALAAGGTVVVGIAIFLVFPRLSGGLFDNPLPSLGPSIVGFTPDMRLGDEGAIVESDTPVMRVVIRRQDGEPISPNFVGYYRANTGNLYRAMRDGRTAYRWLDEGESQAQEFELSSDAVPLPGAMGTVDGLEQRYWLDRLARGRFLFTLYPAVSLRSEKIGRSFRFFESSHTVRAHRYPGGAIDYVVISADPQTAILLDLGKRPPPVEGVRRPDLPAGSPVPAFVQEVMDRARSRANPAAVADEIERRLTGGEYRYTLDNRAADPRAEPVADLLFGRKEGHCEYFATAMTVLCQLAGMNARIVNGYRGGEYNVVGDFFQIRQRDAHSWVEVYVPQRGWVTYDPSPVAQRTRPPSTSWFGILRQYIDNVQFQWLNLVVAYNTQNQGELKHQVDNWLAAANDPSQSRLARLWAVVRSFAIGEGLEGRARVTYWATLLVTVILCALWARLTVVLLGRTGGKLLRARRARRSADDHPVIAFYEQLGRSLAKRGFVRAPHETAREFASRILQSRPDWSVLGELVQLYYAARFGGVSLLPDELASASAFVRLVEQ